MPGADAAKLPSAHVEDELRRLEDAGAHVASHPLRQGQHASPVRGAVGLRQRRAEEARDHDPAEAREQLLPPQDTLRVGPRRKALGEAFARERALDDPIRFTVADLAQTSELARIPAPARPSQARERGSHSGEPCALAFLLRNLLRGLSRAPVRRKRFERPVPTFSLEIVVLRIRQHDLQPAVRRPAPVCQLRPRQVGNRPLDRRVAVEFRVDQRQDDHARERRHARALETRVGPLVRRDGLPQPPSSFCLASKYSIPRSTQRARRSQPQRASPLTTLAVAAM